MLLSLLLQLLLEMNRSTTVQQRQLTEKELLAAVNCPCGVAIEEEQHMASVLHSTGGNFATEKKLFCNRQGLICRQGRGCSAANDRQDCDSRGRTWVEGDGAARGGGWLSMRPKVVLVAAGDGECYRRGWG